jgi:GNAT superfamily N-acetyltransferase
VATSQIDTSVIMPVALCHVREVARHRYFQSSVSERARHAYEEWLALALDENRYFGFVAIDVANPTNVIGGCGLVILDWGPGKENFNRYRGRVVNLFVEPEFRRAGVARKLLTQVLCSAKSFGVSAIGLSSTAIARPLYEEYGFKAVETEMLLAQSSS